MVSVPPPEGMSEVDYEAIEAAVTETVRGRWFLNEFARRNRQAETRLLLDAMARLEATVASNQVALPSADPSIRLLVQRIKEIAGQLDGLSRIMRDDGVDDRHWHAVDHQARAVAGLMRGATPAKPSLPRTEARPEVEARVPEPRLEAPKAPPMDPPKLEARVSAPPRLPRADLPAAFKAAEPADPRLAALSGLDGLPLAKKIALFS